MEPGGGGGEECHVRDGGGRGGWITGILTGAERFLNAVLGSDSPSSSSSSSSSNSLSDRDGHYNLALTSVPNDKRDYVDKNLALISEIDSKEAIENLLIHETFSREESENLIKLIQSRVVDSDAQPISWKKGEVSPNLGFSHSSPNPNFLSLGSSPYRTPEKENEAVKEAKKWLREKKSSDCGPCVLNTNDFDPETGSSPVEVARSFMKSQKDGSNVLKRGYESGDLPDRSTKRVKLMLKETSFDMTNYKKNMEERSFDMTNFKKNIDSNSAIRSAPRAQAPNEASILTAIPLNPLDPRARSSCEIYSFAPKLQNETGQKEQFDNNAWMPYATCAVDPTVVKHEGGVSQNDLCAVSKLMLQEDIVTVSSPSAGGRGGKARRGRAGNGTRAASKPTRGKTNKDLEEEIKEKKPVTRSRRGRGAK